MPVRPPDPAALAAVERVLRDAEGVEPCQEPGYVLEACAASGRPAAVVLPDSDAEAAAALVPLRRVGTFRQAVVPPFAPYSAVLVSPGARLDSLAAAFEAGFDDAIVHLPPGFDTGPLERRGWRVDTLRTFEIDPEAAAARIDWSESTLRNFRKSLGEYSVQRDDAAADAVAGLCVASYRRAGRRPPVAAERAERLARAVVAAGSGAAWTARDAEGALRAGVVTLSRGDRTSYWMAGGEPGHAMTVLLGRLFEELAAAGFRTFDFVGANTPSIAEFKRRFGGRLVEYAAVRTTPNPRLRAALAARATLRSVLPGRRR